MAFGCIILSLVGLINATYFTLAFYGWIEASRLVPRPLCRTDESGCLSVIRTPYARIFGLPNSLLGMGFYLAVMAGLPFMSAHSALRMALLAAGGLVFLVGIYLIYALRVRLRASCPLCYVAHGVNTAILVLMILIVF